MAPDRSARDWRRTESRRSHAADQGLYTEPVSCPVLALGPIVRPRSRAGELCDDLRVHLGAKPFFGQIGKRFAASCIERRSNEVISSKNDSTYDVDG